MTDALNRESAQKAKCGFLLDGRSQMSESRRPQVDEEEKRIRGLPASQVRGRAKVGQARGKQPIK